MRALKHNVRAVILRPVILRHVSLRAIIVRAFIIVAASATDLADAIAVTDQYALVPLDAYPTFLQTGSYISPTGVPVTPPNPDLRIYWPDQSVLDGQWAPPAITPTGVPMP